MRAGQLATTFMVLCVWLFPAAVARAGDNTSGHLPYGMILGVSVRSPNALLDAFDKVAVAASVGTSREIPPGGAQTLVRLYGMIPALGLKTWNQDGEAHLYFHGDLSGKPEYAFVVAVDDFAAFIEEVGTRYPPAAPVAESGAHRVTIPMAGTLLAADLGENQAVLASDDNGLAMIRLSWETGWRPLHWANGVAGAEMVLPEGWREENAYFADLPLFMQLLIDALEEERETLAKAGPRRSQMGGADEESLAALDVALGMADTLLAFAPGITREIDGVRRLAVDIGLDSHSVIADFLLNVDGDTVAGKTAARAMERGVMDVGFAGKFAESAEVLVFNAPVEELVPGAADTAEKAAALCLGRLLDGKSAEYGEAARNFVGHLMGAGMFSLRDAGDGGQIFFKSRTSEPEAAQETFLGLFAMSNRLGDLMEGMEEGKAYIRFDVEDMRTPGGMAYSRIGVTPESLEKAAATLPNPLVRLMVSHWFRSFSLYGAKGDGCFVAAAGLGNAGALLNALERGIGDPDWEKGTAIVREAAAVTAPQLLLALFRLDRFDGLIRHAAFTGRGFADVRQSVPSAQFDAVLPAFTKAQAGFRRSAGVSTLSVGGRPEGLGAELRISLDSLNAIYGNWYLFKNELYAMTRAKADEPNVDAGPALDKKSISVFGDGGGF